MTATDRVGPVLTAPAPPGTWRLATAGRSVLVDRRAALAATVLGALVLLVVAVSLAAGTVRLPLLDTLPAALDNGEPRDVLLVQRLRLPRVRGDRSRCGLEVRGTAGRKPALRGDVGGLLGRAGAINRPWGGESRAVAFWIGRGLPSGEGTTSGRVWADVHRGLRLSAEPR